MGLNDGSPCALACSIAVIPINLIHTQRMENNVIQAHSDMTGKFCIVTGANSGVGKETARKLVKAGADLLMVCRNESKALLARDELLGVRANAKIEVLIADLSLISDVVAVSKKILDKYQKIDLLVNNAGGHITGRLYTEEGNEVNFAVNYLGPYVLTNLLLERIKASAPSRIVNVASEAHRIGSFMRFDDFQNKGSLATLAYMRAKFYLMLFTQSLSKKLAGTEVSVNAVCPGLVASNFFPVEPVKSILKGLARTGIFTINTPEKGSRSTIMAATHPDYIGRSGEFIASYPLTKPFAPMKKVYDAKLQEALWSHTEELTNLNQILVEIRRGSGNTVKNAMET